MEGMLCLIWRLGRGYTHLTQFHLAALRAEVGPSAEFGSSNMNRDRVPSTARPGELSLQRPLVSGITS